MKSALISPLLAGLLLLTGCAQPAAQAGGGGGGTIKAINHTSMSEVARLRFPGVTSPSLHYPQPTGRVR
ncbi:hypothetical protein CK508_018545 [Klebsiella pneumoniae]|nr:hypothetical protein CK508_018545 [Klebsiella pneumoniae]